MSIARQIDEIERELQGRASLVAVSKTYPVEDIIEAYRAGQRDFGENRPQEMREKQPQLPDDVRWHQIGHLQTNKIKYIAPYVHLVHSVDSARLAEAIDREAAKAGRTIDILLEVHIAGEDSKYGWEPVELTEFIASGVWEGLKNIRIRGLMGMATFTDDMEQVRGEFSGLKTLFDSLGPAVEERGGGPFDILSMGMTSDYQVALECGATMVRIGSRIFGARSYDK